jgi:ketosteroid isomerase-like protein
MFRRLILTVILLAVAPVLAAQETDEAIHNELRQLLSGIEEAVNSESYDELAQYFHDSARITTINQEVISSSAEIAPYFEKWFGEGGYLKTLEMRLEADALTEFYADKTFGVVRGSGDEDYVLSDTRFFPMKTRWTATVSKTDTGEWRILTLHIGTNFLDNPILSMAEGSVKNVATGAGVVGLLLGLVIGFFVGRGKKAA